MDKQTLIQQAKVIILRHSKPERIWLYGSHALGTAKPESDIDIAFWDTNHPDVELIKEAIEQLNSLVKVDVVELSACELRFQQRVKGQGIVLDSADKKLRAEDGLHNFSKALDKFGQIVDNQAQFTQDGYQDIFLDLLVKRFEFTFEMSWKAIKRYLEFVGLESCTNPRSCFKEAYQQQLLDNEQIWLDMIEMRNLTSHVYDESQVRGLLNKQHTFQQSFLNLREKLRSQLE
jgi:nucleotidyltransferase substrate binding protein (TIGR01987 family)